MITLALPYHLDERLDDFAVGLPVDRQLSAELPEGDRWHRMAALYESVADAVADAAGTSVPLVVSGDCTTSLGVLAGMQRAGLDPGIVWFDAHADFHTEHSTTSGYVGGMPLALAVGVGTLTLPQALRLREVPAARVLLVDARDTDPGESILLQEHQVAVLPATELTESVLPTGQLYLHVDLDVCDPRDVPDLLYPTPDGPSLDEVCAALASVSSTGRVAAVGLALTWRHGGPSSTAQEHVVRRVAGALGG